MRAADNARREPGIQRGRGGFLRNGADVPYVTDPTGATTQHDGLKADLIALCVERGITVPDKITVAQLHELLGRRPVRVPYGSPSNRGKLIENSTNLTKWGERRVCLGIGADPALVEMCAQLVALDVDSDEYKTLADTIVVKAKDAAEANLAAERGTHVHALTEDHDEERDWVQRAQAGELVGIPLAVQQQAVTAWADFLTRHGLEVLAVEASCVDDTWRLAGTLDRILRCTRPLRFRRVTGEIVEIPASSVIVGDVKTSKKRLGRDGVVGWWQAYAIQIASYAQSVPYDTETEQRGTWPWPIDQTHALILRPNVVEVLAGEADRVEWELIHVDLVAGREHGGATVVAAKEWEQRRDIFSVAQLDATQIAGEEGVDFSIDATPDSSPAQIAVSAPDTSPAPLRAGPGTPPTTAVEPSTLGADTAFIAPPRERPASVPLVAEPEDDTTEPGDVPDAAPASVCAVEQPTAAGVSPQAPAAVLSPANPRPATEQALSPLRQAQADRARQNAQADAKRRLHQQPSEGDDSDGNTFASVEARYRQLDAAGQAWIKRLAADADAAKVPFGAKTAKTARRFSILVALTALARDEAKRANRVDDDWLDETARALLYAIIGDVALFPTVPLGHLVGSLNATEADTFAGLCTGRLAIAVDDTGTQVVAA